MRLLMNSEGTTAIEPKALREIMRRWSSGVTIVSSGDGENSHGMTASSFASVSLEPPLVLVSVRRSTRTSAWIANTGRFAVTILRAEQQQLADRFAGRTSHDSDRFDGIPVLKTPSGIPYPDHGLAAIECQLYRQIEAGTHWILLGLVTWGDVREVSPPLLYFNRGYRRLDLK
jgi:flavin reductase (DIM6/NTAB) family NADH-FMN oxidoreductase RutF